MAKGCDRSSARLSGGTYGTTTIAVYLQRTPQATGRGMLIGSLNAKDPLPQARSLHGLDWLNFSLAALLMGFGPFVAVKLADRGWVPANIGLVLTASGVAALLTQVPAGELIDLCRSKRLLVGMATTAIVSAVLVFGPRPDFPSVFTGALIQGTAGSVLGPGVAAISLGLVGQEALAERLGRNQRFASIGGLAAAGITGIIGYLLSTAALSQHDGVQSASAGAYRRQRRDLRKRLWRRRHEAPAVQAW